MSISTRIRTFFKETYLFVSSKVFLKSFGYLLLSFLIFAVVLFWFLDFYTLHGESIEVPNLKGLTIEQAQKQVKARRLRLEVSDSLYEAEKTPGTILEQTPKPSDRVKRSRTIYLTINSTTPPLVNLFYGDLIGRPLSFIERKFRGLDLKIGKIDYISGKGENTCAQALLDGKTIFFEVDPSKGQKIPDHKRVPRSSTIDLVLYRGQDADLQMVPDVFCMKYTMAEFTLKGSNFYVGNVTVDPSVGLDTLGAYVWKQSPPSMSRANMGTAIDLWLIKEKPEGCDQ